MGNKASIRNTQGLFRANKEKKNKKPHKLWPERDLKRKIRSENAAAVAMAAPYFRLPNYFARVCDGEETSTVLWDTLKENIFADEAGWGQKQRGAFRL